MKKQYRLISILEMSHLLLSHVIDQDSVVVDMTLGNGYDSEFLAPKVKHVYGFDISQQAIDSSKERLKDIKNITLFRASHDTFLEHIENPEQLDLFLFNLGYLPLSDKSIVTTKETTMLALERAYTILKSKACIQLVCYVGHAGGMEEYLAVRNFCESIKTQAEIVQYDFINAKHSAKLIMISKK